MTTTHQNNWTSSALMANLERTAVTVEIPEVYAPLLEIAEGHHGLLKKTTGLLVELHHPFVNWNDVLKDLKDLAIGHFHTYNRHPNSRAAFAILFQIFFRIIQSPANMDTRDSAIRDLFDLMDTILSQGRENMPPHISLLQETLDQLTALTQEEPTVFVRASSYVKRTAKSLSEDQKSLPVEMFEPLFGRTLEITYRFWLTQPDPAGWTIAEGETNVSFDAYQKLIHPLSHPYLQTLLKKLESLRDNPEQDKEKRMAAYLDLPDFFQISHGYLLVADQLGKTDRHPEYRQLMKINFLLMIIRIPGLSDIHGTALREISHSLHIVFQQEERKDYLSDLVHKIFVLLRRSGSQNAHRGAIIDCLTTMAREVFEQNSHPLVNTFIDELIAYGFQYPEIMGATAEWQVQVNPAHIENIRSWLKIIALKPRWTKRLVSALIIHLKIGGIFVRDTDLMQKDISALLAADIAPAYNVIKQLLRSFPVYFTEIGAEGELRDISTRVDDLSGRKDKVVNFLRKQSHVDSNSLLVGFVEDIFQFWFSGKKRFVKKHLPAEVYEQVEAAGEYFDGMHRAFRIIFSKVQNNPRLLLKWERTRVHKTITGLEGLSDRDKERILLMVRLYQLLTKKYHPQYLDLLKDLEAAKIFPLADIASLRQTLDKKYHYRSIVIVLKFLSILKAKVLTPKPLQFTENIYYKRHIAAGIPSMYGTYHEEKFDALGLSLRLESLAAVLFEDLVGSLNLKFITKRTMIKIHAYLWLFIRALELEGISIEGLVARVKYVTSALPVKQFSIDQYIDIFRFISKGIQDIIRDYYIDTHSSNLPVIIRQVLSHRREQTDEPVTAKSGEEKTVYQYSENFLREMISSTFGLQVLDNFISTVINTLSAEREKFKDNKQILNLVMAYNPEYAISNLYKRNKRLDNQILLGNKGYFLKELASFGFHVPPGFIITTEVFRGYDAVYGYKYIFKDLAVRVGKEISRLEKLTGRKFGDNRNPLLLSVRSGATISLPGMMQSFLNVGINASIAEGLSQNRAFRWAAWDSYRRFLQSWGMFQGHNRDFFDVIMESFKRKYQVTKKIRFLPEQMKELALAYKKEIEDHGIQIPDDPVEQLRHAIQQVFGSWHSIQASLYRHQMHLSDEWGTAVVVQTMVFGNLNEHSGSGVIFTRDPKGSSFDVSLCGDFIFGVQGHDIVSGLVETYPISEDQRTAENRESGISLELKFPDIYAELVRMAEILIYEKGFNHQEIEFTFEGPTRNDLYILQTRDMVQIKTERLRRFKDASSLQTTLLGMGTGVSGGALSGRAVYTEKDIEQYRHAEPETPLILIRPDTVPDDIGMLLQVEGLLTAKGGATCHAAVTIPQLNKVGVVGFSKLKVYERDGYAAIDGRTIRAGDWIAIDGWSGSVYSGKHEWEAEESSHLFL